MLSHFCYWDTKKQNNFRLTFNQEKYYICDEIIECNWINMEHKRIHDPGNFPHALFIIPHSSANLKATLFLFLINNYSANVKATYKFTKPRHKPVQF